MNRHFFGLIGVLAAVGGSAVACKDTPVAASGLGSPVKLVTDFNQLTFNGTGLAQTVTARVLDNTSTPLEQAINVASCNNGVATAIPTATQAVPPVSLAVSVTGISLNATCVVFTSNGVAPDTVQVVVLPVDFPGALSASTVAGGDTLIIHSTATLKFDTSKVTVTYPSGGSTVTGTTFIASKDSLGLLVPFGALGKPTITGIAVTYVSGLDVTLTSTTQVEQSGELWTGYASWQTAPDITGILPASGDTTYFLTQLPPATSNNVAVCPEAVLGAGSFGPCAIFKFTLAAPTTLNFTTDWTGTASNPDVDIYSCSDSTLANFGTACFEDGGAGATGKKPQATGNFTYPAGTHYFVIENYCIGDPNEVHCQAGSSPNNYVMITRP